MTTWADFIERICDEPADDALRLIAADWLDENGEADRAEFIRVQVEESSAPSGCLTVLKRDCNGTKGWWCVRCRLLARQNDLIRSSAWRWLRDDLPDAMHFEYDRWENKFGLIRSKRDDRMDLEYRRGFIEHVSLSFADFMTHAVALFDAAPITSVRLTDREPAGPVAGGAYQGQWVWTRRDFTREVWGFLTDQSSLVWPTCSAPVDTRDAAIRQISDALVSYGRSFRRQRCFTSSSSSPH